MRIAVVTPVPTPYRDPFWTEVAGRPNVELQVYYCSSGKQDRPWDVTWERRFVSQVLPGKNLVWGKAGGASCFWNPGITKRLQAGRFDVIIVGGYNHPTMWLAMRFARANNVPYFLMCESHLNNPRSRIRQWLKDRPVRWAIRNAAGGLPTGQLAEQYMIAYGASPHTLTRIPNVPDVRTLYLQSRELRRNRQALRRKHGLDDAPTILFAARMIPKKRPMTLLSAFAQIACATRARLVMVGDGELRPTIDAFVRDQGLESRVHLPGFVQPDQMVQWYAMSDLFVLPSSETWGVVVIEALACGLPVIVTDEVGCHPDVLTGHTVGQAIPAGDEAALSDALTQWLHSPVSSDAISKAWAVRRGDLSNGVLADRFITAAAGAEETFRKRATLECSA